MIKLVRSLQAWNTAGFEQVVKEEIQGLASGSLPLQQGLSQSSYVSENGFNVLFINAREEDDDIVVKVGIHYSGIIAGSCCADDPAPVDELAEYCELQFKINKLTAEASVSIVNS